MNSYLFELGDYESGAASVSVRVHASSREEALQEVQEKLGKMLDEFGIINIAAEKSLEYVHLHIDPYKITLENIACEGE
jgi:hypothetical protein